MPAVRLNSSRIAETLVNRFGILPAKSFGDPPMPDVPEEHLPFFVRGVADGDGTICRSVYHQRNEDILRTRFTLLGTPVFIEMLQKRIAAALDLPILKLGERKSQPNLRTVTWGSSADVTTILRWVYPPGDYLCLKRKRAIADEHLASPFADAPRANRYTATQWDEMIAAYATGASLQSAASIHGATPGALRYEMSRRGLRPR